MFPTLDRHLHFARVLKSRSFAMLWFGQTISSMGNSIFSIALAWQVLLLTRSATAIGIVLLAVSLPQLVFLLLGGVTADRLPRRLIILCSDSVCGLIVLLITILGLIGYLSVWLLVIESLIFGISISFFRPAIGSIITDLVPKDELNSANAWRALSDNIAQLLGPLLGALLIALITPLGAFAINALSFFIAVLFLLPVRIQESHMTAAPQTADRLTLTTKITTRRGRFHRVIADMAEGLDYVRKLRWWWVTTICAAIGNIGIVAPLTVALPLLVHNVYIQGAWLLGLIGSSGAIGSILALLIIGQAKTMRRRGIVTHLLMIPTCMGFIIFGLPFSHTAAAIVAPLAGAMIGFGLAYFNTVWFTITQEMIPREKLGRVLSLDTLGSKAMVPVAQGLGGFLTDGVGPALVCIMSGVLCLITVIIPLLVRDVREID